MGWGLGFEPKPPIRDVTARLVKYWSNCVWIVQSSDLEPSSEHQIQDPIIRGSDLDTIIRASDL